MIRQVLKRRKRTADGQLRLSRSYYLRYRIGDMASNKFVTLDTTDRLVAEKKANHFLEDFQREQAGIIEPRLRRDAAKAPLKQHLEDYLADMGARGRNGRSGRGGRLLKNRVLVLLNECSWVVPGDVTADSFTRWRSGNVKHSVRTKNHYLQGMCGLLNWMERNERIRANPLRRVTKVDERASNKRRRRAFTDEELVKLVDGSGPRGIIYFMAARTGIRQDELRQLLWSDLCLEPKGSKVPHVIVRDLVAKNRTEAKLPLVNQLIEALRTYRPRDFAGNEPVFPNGIPRASRLQKDLERCGIPYQDEQGRYADFHALRYTWCTFLARSGFSQRQTMKLMRHHDPSTTAKVYTDDSQLRVEEMVAQLPALGCTHGCAHISDAKGHSVPFPGVGVMRVETAKIPAFIQKKPDFSEETGLVKMEREKGFEPSTFTLAR